MFYVKGSAFLASLSRPNNRKTPVSAKYPLQVQSQGTEADHLIAKDATSWLPICISTAGMLCIFSLLYTLMIIPTAFGTELFGASVPTNRTTNYSSLALDLQCPHLRPRSQKRATSVQDLRPDDISAVLGIGDSVMAGFAAKGITNGRFISMDSLNEDRGVSFAMGGDMAAITVPNMIRYYSPALVGPSVGEHLLSVCFGDQFCPKGQYRESVDVLNAAQSGARSLNLNHEIDYLLDRLDEYYEAKTLQPTDWKLLTFFIGSNDLCHACAVPSSLPVQFAVDVAAAIERIRNTIRNVFVQVVGLMSIDQIFIATQAHPEYCQPFERSTFVVHDHECMCAHTAINRTIMSNLTPQYNMALEEIVGRFQPNDTFAVVYQPLKMDIDTFPIQAISNIDCFHPSEYGHSWFAKELWRMMFLPRPHKHEVLKFNQSVPIYCPTEADRFTIA